MRWVSWTLKHSVMTVWVDRCECTPARSAVCAPVVRLSGVEWVGRALMIVGGGLTGVVDAGLDRRVGQLRGVGPSTTMGPAAIRP